MKVYEIMAKLEDMPSGTEVFVGGYVTDSEFCDLPEEDEDLRRCVRRSEDCYYDADSNRVDIMF